MTDTTLATSLQNLALTDTGVRNSTVSTRIRRIRTARPENSEKRHAQRLKHHNQYITRTACCHIITRQMEHKRVHDRLKRISTKAMNQMVARRYWEAEGVTASLFEEAWGAVLDVRLGCSIEEAKTERKIERESLMKGAVGCRSEEAEEKGPEGVGREIHGLCTKLEQVQV